MAYQRLRGAVLSVSQQPVGRQRDSEGFLFHRDASLEDPRMEEWKNGRMETPIIQPSNQPSNQTPFLIGTPVSDRPTWLQLCLSRPQRVPQFVSSYLYRLEAEHWLGPQPLPSR